MPQTEQVEQIIQFIDLTGVPFAVTLIVLGWLAMWLLRRFLGDMAERFTERRLLLKKLEVLTRFFLYLAIAVVASTSVLELQGEALLALLGTIGLALGFAFKDLLASLMAGVILLLDEPFQLGDRISFGGYYGEVTAMGLRSVRLTTLDDNLVSIPNSRFLTESVASANAGALDCMVVVPFYVSAGENFYRARRLVAEATATSRYVFLEKPVVTLVSDEFLGERFVTVIRVKAYVFDARFEKAFASDVTERVKAAFRASGIVTPDQAYRDLEIHGHEAQPDA